MAPRLAFILEGAGWARVEISSPAGRRQIESISYCSDALDDLLRMGIDIATDKHWAAAEFDHEGASTVLVAETAWIEENDWKGGARLSAISGNKLSAPGLSWSGIRHAERLFEVHFSSRDELAGLFLAAGREVFEKHGVAGYRRAWGGRLAFPIRALRALEAALDVPSYPMNDYNG